MRRIFSVLSSRKKQTREMEYCSFVDQKHIRKYGKHHAIMENSAKATTLYSDMIVVASQLDAQHSSSQMMSMAGSALAFLGAGAFMLSPLLTVPAMGLSAAGILTSAGTKLVTNYSQKCAIKEASEKWETFRKSQNMETTMVSPPMEDDIMKKMMLKAAESLFNKEKNEEELKTKLEEISKAVLDTDVSELEKYQMKAANYLSSNVTLTPDALLDVRKMFLELLQTSDLSVAGPHLAKAMATIPLIINRAVFTWSLIDLIQTSLELYQNETTSKPGDFLRNIASQLYGFIGDKDMSTQEIDEDGWELVM